MTEWLGAHPYGEGFGSVFSAVGATVRSTEALSIANNASTIPAFNVEVYDNGGFFDSANSTFFTVPAGMGGVYSVGGQCQFMSEVSRGLGQLQIVVNGAFGIAGDTSRFSSADGIAGFATQRNAAGAWPLASGDTVALFLFQNSGSARTTRSDASTGCSMWIYRLDNR